MIGTRVGHYEILELMGVGGMGEVYRARDVTLDRIVAIKVLPEEWAGDGDRLARLQREAKVLAQLDHPNVAAIYGLEEETTEGGAPHRLLIMQLAEGETLQEWIEDDRVSTGKALEIALQMAAGLESAHERGVVHRDLKPANVKVSEDAGGHAHVKLLDFGLAKAYDPDGSSSDISPEMSGSPTVLAATRTGVILGTAAYMSPEQARGKPVDKRADIWAFGVVLFEMLSRQRLFRGESVSDTVAEVLKTEPDWSRLPPDVPPRVERMLRRCLEKDPMQRLRDIGEARVLLEKPHGAEPAATEPSTSPGIPISTYVEAGPGPGTGPGAAAAGSSVGRLLPWAIAALSVAALVWVWTSRPEAAAPTYEVAIGAPVDSEFVIGTNAGNAIVSPDGTKVAFVASTDGSPQLFVRSLDREDPVALLGTDDPHYPFWAPDSRRLAFFADQSLKTIDIDGGLPETIAPAINGRGGSWGPDGTILFTPNGGSTVHRVPENGGDVVRVTTLDENRAENAHYWPEVLPGGDRFLYFVRSANAENSGIYLGYVDGSEPSVRLIGTMSSGIYAPPLGSGNGHLLWVRGGELLAQPLDLAAAELTGTAAVVATGVRVEQAQRGLIASVSNNGVLVWAAALAEAFVVQWHNRQGLVTDGLEIEPGFIQHLSLSPDGSRLAFALPEEGTSDIWLHDFETGTTRAIIAGPGFEELPVWTAAGDRIMYVETGTRLMSADPDGVGEARTLAEVALGAFPLASPDDAFLIYAAGHPEGGRAPAAIAMDGSGDPVFLTEVQTPANAIWGFSPDGEWALLSSARAGQPALYAARWIVEDGVPRLGETWTRVSDTLSNGAARWTTSGEVIYTSADNWLVAVPVTQTGDGLELGRESRMFAVTMTDFAFRFLDIAADGQSFIIRTAPYAEGQTLRMLTHWQSRLPGGGR